MNPIKLTGFFMEPQNLSVNDGDGIRTIVFFAGCPLRCKWCSNPESHVDIKRCEDNQFIHKYSVEDLLNIIERQLIFYRYSGGGVTFSGGETTLQPEILRELTNRLYDKGIDLAIETSGYFNFHEIKDILEKLDLIFIDIKHMDDKKHRDFTGVSNRNILDNIKLLNTIDTSIVIRIPSILGVNADSENIKGIARFVKENLNDPKIEILPYHSFGDEKYEILNLEKPSREYKTPSREVVKEIERIIESEGVSVVGYK